MAKPMSAYLKLTLLLVVFLTGAVSLRAQGQYGNEWINYNQTYHKLKVVNTGLHRLDYADLETLGFANINPKNLQLFRRGKEVAIYVAGEADGKLDNQDFIEFYGERNDGALDAELYKNPAHQMHEFYSLYTDTAAYFLTVAPTAGKRMVEQNLAINGKTPEPYFIQKSIYVNTERYYLGKVYNIQFNMARMPWMDEGEGYASHSSRNPKQYVIQNLTDIFLAGPKPRLEYIVGASNPITHEFAVNLLTPTVNKLLSRFEIEGDGFAKGSAIIEFSDIATDRVTIQTVPDAHITTQNQISFAYGSVVFPQKTIYFSNQLTFYTDSTRSTTPFFELSGAPATAVAFDVTDSYNVIRISGHETGANKGFVIGGAANTHKVLIADITQPWKPVGQVKDVKFDAIDPAGHNYVIITNKLLNKKVAGANLTAPEEYAAYRASQVGGGYKTLLLEMSQIVDQFHYGEFSSNSIRKLMQFMSTSPQPKHLFLLGKGVKYAGNDLQGSTGGKFSYYHIDARSPRVHEIDLVPTGISPSSDLIFTANFRNGDLAPDVSTGRLPATTPEDIISYLNKVKEYEAIPEGQPWQKNILQLGGGTTAFQINQIATYLTTFKEIAEGPFFGANVIEKYRQNVSQVVETINVSKEVNNGLSLITFFGHSSSSTNDLDIGYVSSSVNGYANKGKYPVILMNGCNAGDAFIPGFKSFGEDWLLTPDKGAVAFMAHLDTGFDAYMYLYSANFYAAAFQDPDLYGSTLGKIQQEVIKRFRKENLQGEIVAMLTQVALQGDPAVRLYSPSKPDYLIQQDGLQVKGKDNDILTADSETFEIEVDVENLGKALEDSVLLSVKRTLADNTVIQYDPIKIDSVYRKVKVFIPVDNRDVNATGLNTFEVKIDSRNEFEELDESNNLATVQHFFPVNGLFALSPAEYGIVNSNNVTLTVKASRLDETREGFVIEVDTTNTFESNAKKSFSAANAILASVPVDLSTLGNMKDSTVFFWRARFKNYSGGEDTLWATSSFRLINGTSKGWSQSHPGQFAKATTEKLQVSNSKPYFQFLPQKSEINLKTVGGDQRYTNPPYGIFVDGEQLFQAMCSDPGGSATPRLFMIVVDDKSLQKVGGLGSGVACGNAPYLYEFGDMNNATNRAKVEAFLKVIPVGFHVAVMSVNNVPFESFTPEQRAAFKTIGSGQIDNVKNGYPYALVGRKGSAPGSAQERTGVSGETTTPTSQSIALRVELASRQQSGEITSTVIGPALEWSSLHHTIRKNQAGEDAYKLTVIGRSLQGQQEVLLENVNSRTVDLASIDAKQYPYLQLKASLSDLTDRTAPQLEEWMVLYTEAPEGIIRPDLVTINEKLLTEQANVGKIKVPMVFQNISSTAFQDSLVVDVTVTGEGMQPIIKQLKLKALEAGSSENFEFTMSTLELVGNYRLIINVNPRLQPEQHYFNNIYEVAFEVDKKLHPIMDVAFDGVHIMDGELVSPSPVISVTVKDQNKHIFLQDPEGMTLKLIKEGVETEIALTGNQQEVKYFPADEKNDFRLEFKPANNLENGIYTLEVNAKDVTGKAAGVSPYRIDFEVENESTITNFYPYPNPFSTKTQFIFTLTGATIPNNMKIQIMTVTGKVVKEIMKEEMGPIRIGNNKTDYAWDGSDMFGDRLANGVYLYRVVLSQDAAEIQHKNKKSDKAFTNGYGKLYILR